MSLAAARQVMTILPQDAFDFFEAERAAEGLNKSEFLREIVAEWMGEKRRLREAKKEAQ